MSAPITPVIMPKWGLEMREGTLSAWRVQPGTRIGVGMPICDVDTDKISNTVEAPDPGLLRRRVATEGQTLPVKALLAVLAEESTSDAEIDAFIQAYELPSADAVEEEAGPAYDWMDVDGIRLRYARRGSWPDAGPDAGAGLAAVTPVLFLHGFGGDLNNWLFNLDAVAAKHPVLALDLPGHGQSQVALPGTTWEALASHTLKFLDAVGVRRAHLVGHSMGGAIALHMALGAPERVATLSLIAPAGLGETINSGYTEGFAQATGRRDLKPVLEQLFADPARVSRAMIEDLLRYKRLDGVSGLLQTLGQATFAGGRQLQPAAADRLADCGCPVLVIWGQDDRVIPSEQMRLATQATPLLLDGAGHMPMMEKANEVNAALLRQFQTRTEAA